MKANPPGSTKRKEPLAFTGAVCQSHLQCQNLGRMGADPYGHVWTDAVIPFNLSGEFWPGGRHDQDRLGAELLDHFDFTLEGRHALGWVKGEELRPDAEANMLRFARRMIRGQGDLEVAGREDQSVPRRTHSTVKQARGLAPLAAAGRRRASWACAEVPR